MTVSIIRYGGEKRRFVVCRMSPILTHSPCHPERQRGISCLKGQNAKAVGLKYINVGQRRITTTVIT